MQIYISNFKLWSLKMLAYVKKYHIHLIAFSNKMGGEDKYYIQFIRPSIFLNVVVFLIYLKGISSFFQCFC